MSSIGVQQNVLEERKYIKDFTNDFNKVNDGVNDKILGTMNKLNVSIADEININGQFKSLDEQINSLILANTLKNLVAIKNNITDKFKEYNDLLSTNNALSSKIYNNIKENKQVIDGIYKTVSIINENLKNINDVLDKYNSL